MLARALQRLLSAETSLRVLSTHRCSAVPSLLISTRIMAGEPEKEIGPFRRAVKEQADLVRSMKADGRPNLEVQAAVAELKKRKSALDKKEKELAPKEDQIDRAKLEDTLKRRFFYAPAFSIYGGVAGLYDFGPMGCAMKSNLFSLWRQHFVLEEGMLEIDSCILTPEPVLKASGHMDRFTDFMVKDEKTGECFRADHLLEDVMEKLMVDPKCTAEKKAEYQLISNQADSYTQEELAAMFTRFSVTAPVTGNPLSQPMDFNLMFKTSIGPGGTTAGFLRPETAQGIFVNFKRLLEFNNGRLPFAAAQIGKAFRNEISPRSGLLRVREFEMAEIEHFVHPEKRNSFHKFRNVSDLRISFFSACNQMDGKPAETLPLGEAVRTGLVANETLGYYIGRIFLFLTRAGIEPEKLRFRQHMSNEMAHYASDCWDAECLTTYGWVECVGCADRSCFDLNCHMTAAKVDMSAKEDLPEPRTVDVVEVVPEKGIIGKQFRREGKGIMDQLASLSSSQAEELEKETAEKGSYELTVGDKTFTLLPSMFQVKRYQKKVHVVDVIPSVIEPSFGIGRILYAILEHSFRVREGDEQRVWLALPAVVAPISCSVLPLSGNDQFTNFIQTIAEGLKLRGISHKIDDSGGSIGRRYARTDEIGIPFGITVDFDSVQSDTATLRERNSMRQIRAKIQDLPVVVEALVGGTMTWSQVEEKYPSFTGQESTQ